MKRKKYPSSPLWIKWFFKESINLIQGIFEGTKIMIQNDKGFFLRCVPFIR
jgi:hypothetical protein